jgi:hypothetical protein
VTVRAADRAMAVARGPRAGLARPMERAAPARWAARSARATRSAPATRSALAARSARAPGPGRRIRPRATPDTPLSMVGTAGARAPNIRRVGRTTGAAACIRVATSGSPEPAGAPARCSTPLGTAGRSSGGRDRNRPAEGRAAAGRRCSWTPSPKRRCQQSHQPAAVTAKGADGPYRRARPRPTRYRPPHSPLAPLPAPPRWSRRIGLSRDRRTIPSGRVTPSSRSGFRARARRATARFRGRGGETAARAA